MAGERASKAAIRELADLLDIDRASARAFLREVQVRCGPVPFRAIVDRMRVIGADDVEHIARHIEAGRPVAAGAPTATES